MRRAGIINYICGYFILRVRDGAAFANLLLEQGILTWNPRLCDGYVTLCVLRSEYKRLVLPDSIKVEVVREVGLPQYFRRYRNRPGIAAGALLFAVTLYLSTMFIWDIEIKGAENIPEEEITEKLAALGCGVGSFIPSINFYELCNDYLAETGNVSWISVNLRGTVAYVELRERVMPEESEISDTPANIVAASDGIVERVEVYSGIAAVKAGDPVEKGQLLISGIIDSTAVGYRAIRAKGKVIAQTAALLEVEVPLDTTEKVYTGNTYNEKTIKIFGKSINLFIKGRNFYEKYDTIEEIRNVTLFDDLRLPMTVRTVTYREYTEQKRTMTEAEAASVAALRLSEEFAERFARADILSRTVESGLDGGVYRITCEVSCSEDIGITKELGQ
jgi:similar to stage IV sporulation protein